MHIDIAGLPPERIVFETSPSPSWGSRSTPSPSRDTTPACTAGRQRPPPPWSRTSRTGCTRPSSCGGTPSPTSSCRSPVSTAGTAGPARRSPRTWTSWTGWTTNGSSRPPWNSPVRVCTTPAPPPRSPTRGRGPGRSRWRPPGGRGNWTSPGSCWPTPPPYAYGSGVSWRTATRPSSPTPGGASRSSSPPTHGTRPSCCGARAPGRPWKPSPRPCPWTSRRAGSASTSCPRAGPAPRDRPRAPASPSSRPASAGLI